MSLTNYDSDTMTVPRVPRNVARQAIAARRLLFEPKRFDRVKPSRFSGWIKPKEHSGGGSKAKCHADGIGRNRRRPLQKILSRGGQAISHRDSEQTAEEAEDDGFHEELHEDVFASCPDGHTQS